VEVEVEGEGEEERATNDFCRTNKQKKKIGFSARIKFSNIFVTNAQKRVLHSSNVYNFKQKTIQDKNVFWPMKQHFPKFFRYITSDQDLRAGLFSSQIYITSDIEHLTPKYQLFHIYRQVRRTRKKQGRYLLTTFKSRLSG
jgi:hypothetical protein